MQLHQEYGQFTAKKTVIVVIGPENARRFREYWDQHNYPFYGVPDEKHTVLTLYGQQVNLFKFGRMPAQMLVDQKGILRYVYYGHSMQDIPKSADVLSRIDETGRVV